jgi:lysine biosynthesis protein LysW
MAVGFCPECDVEIHFRKEPKEGQKITCPNCTANLVVIGLHPIELDWAYAEEQFVFGEEEFES